MKINTPKSGNPSVDVHIKILGSIEESKTSHHQREEIKNAEQRSSIVISVRVKKFLEHLQALEVDPLGLGLIYQVNHGTTQKDVDEWKSIYPNLEFHVKTDVTLKGTGSMY